MRTRATRRIKIILFDTLNSFKIWTNPIICNDLLLKIGFNLKYLDPKIQTVNNYIILDEKNETTNWKLYNFE